MKSDFAQTLLRKVRSDYQILAEKYSASREDIWPEFNEFKKYVQPEMKIADIGCGNGRLAKIFDGVKVDYYGVDISPRLLEQARKLFPDFHFQEGDILNLPFPDNEFDLVFSILVLHQIPSAELRQRAVSQLFRVINPGGRLILTVWNLWRPKYQAQIKKTNWKHLFGFTPLDKNDLLIPWRDSGIEQYYHAFTQEELKGLLEEAGFKIERMQLAKEFKTGKKRFFNNIIVIAQKPE